MKEIKYILSLSYGKDSLACLEAINRLNLPLDYIIHADIWATDEINADLPLMVEFKEKADKIIKDRYGMDVIHIQAVNTEGEPLTYEKMFYGKRVKGKHVGSILGFPMTKGQWCNKLKIKCFTKKRLRTVLCGDPTAPVEFVQYLGIAADEPERIERHKSENIRLPLVETGWDEAYCRKWCEDNDLLSPIYTSSNRGGVGFATSNLSGSLGCCGLTTLPYGNFCLSGI